MLALYIIFFIVIGLYLIRVLNNRYVETKFKYELFALRDEIRMKALKGKIDADGWLFKFYDNSISKNIQYSYYITLFSLLLNTTRFKDSDEINQFMDKLNSAIEETEDFNIINEKYIKILRKYIQNQHAISIFMLIPIVSTIIGISNIVKKINSLITKTYIYGSLESINQFI